MQLSHKTYREKGVLTPFSSNSRIEVEGLLFSNYIFLFYSSD